MLEFSCGRKLIASRTHRYRDATRHRVLPSREVIQMLHVTVNSQPMLRRSEFTQTSGPSARADSISCCFRSQRFRLSET